MAQKVRVSHSVTIPDELKLARYRRTPELGPRILFFSGGTALNPLSRQLTEYTHNSIHVVTPFDSGGSSRVLREAFDMPSVGDLRSRLMAMADLSVHGHPEIYELFSHRFTAEADPQDLRKRLVKMIEGDDPLVAQITDPMRKIIRQHLRYFAEAMPIDFNLRGASIGNLILVGGYLNNDRHLDPVIFMFSKLVEVRGTVRPVMGDSLHLIGELEDGTLVRGQRELTGKEVPPIGQRVKRVYLSDDPNTAAAVEPGVHKKTRELIGLAELICYPMGSFYSSVIANLLPVGVSVSIRGNECPKVYIPNLGTDPEQYGISVAESVEALLHYLRLNGNESATTSELLNFVLLDTENGSYNSAVNASEITDLGVEVIDTRLIRDQDGTRYDEQLLAGVLLSLT